MTYKIIDLVTKDYDKSIVFYGEYGSKENMQKIHLYLMREFHEIPKTFRIVGATIDFNSTRQDQFENRIVAALTKLNT